MNRIKASIGITALVVASLGFSAPTQASETASISAPSVVSFETPEAALNFEEVSVVTIPAPAPIVTTVEEPAPIVEAEPAPVEEAPVTISAPPATEVQAPTPTEPTQPVVEPEAPATDPYSGNPIIDCEALGMATTEDYTCAPLDYWDTPEGGQMMYFQGDGVESAQLFEAAYPGQNYGSYRGIYKAGAAPQGNYTVIPSVENPGTIYVFVTDQMLEEPQTY